MQQCSGRSCFSSPRCRVRTKRSAAKRTTSASSAALYVAKRYGVLVDESGVAGRTLRDYCRLPAERYNVLDNKAVQRLDKCVVRPLETRAVV
jgi:hypothetical protein